MPDRFRELIANARDIFAIVDRSGAITYVNPAIQATLGRIPTEVVGSVLWEVVHPSDVVQVRSALNAAFEQGGRQRLEFQMVDVNAVWHRLEALVHLLDGDAGAGLIATDVTEQRRSEAVLRQRDEQLRQAYKMEVLGRLAAGISHDFGNLLTVIIGASGQLLDGLESASGLRSHAESIKLTAERAGVMVRQLLGFGRLHVQDPEVLDANQVVIEAEQLLHRLLGEHIKLRTICGADLWPISANRNQIEQVLLNLAVNARDAMPEGGTLTIETRNVSGDALTVRLPRATSGGVAISVSDTGVGMDHSTQAKAFEPFFTTKGLGKGTGLGLSTVHNIVKDGGGWIELVSALGKGTTITFGFPRVLEAPVGQRPAAASVRGGTETLLLVEDEPGVRELVRDMLDLAGYTVLEAAMPSEAERLSHEFSGDIQLLLTDVVMPEMSGLELSARLRVARPDLQVMYMSGFPEPTVGDGSAEAPGAHFISKPFDRQGLLRSVRRALDATDAPGGR